MRVRLLSLGALLVGVLLLGPGAGAAPPVHAGSGLTITPVSPTPNSTAFNTTPTISASFSDNVGGVVPSSVILLVDNANVTGLPEVVVTPQSVVYNPPSILALSLGLHNVTVSASDASGNSAARTWSFTVNPNAAPKPSVFGAVDLGRLVIEIGIGAAVVAAGFGGYVVYLRRARRFTFRKYFVTHPNVARYLVLYVPVAFGFVVTILGLIWVTSTRGLPQYAPEYVLIGGLIIALLPFALDAQRELRLRRRYERAFAQLLFEMADAMRGGLDPAKALVELSTTHTDVLERPLRIAADGIRMGRPFDQVLVGMVAPMRSPLITRYAELIADASTVGGETSAVIHRAAKDMDDFFKIEVERSGALTLPVAVLYISYGVLLAVLFSLLSIAPSLGSVNVSFLSGNPLSGTPVSHATIPKLDLPTLRGRFFDLALINSLGNGLIIGAFTEGRVKYELLHSIALLVASALAFYIFTYG